jgi:hypothetical protein
MSGHSRSGEGEATGIKVIQIPQPGGWGEQFCLARPSETRARGERPVFAWYCGIAGFRHAPAGGASNLNIVRFRSYARAVARARELEAELTEVVGLTHSQNNGRTRGGGRGAMRVRTMRQDVETDPSRRQPFRGLPTQRSDRHRRRPVGRTTV